LNNSFKLLTFSSDFIDNLKTKSNNFSNIVKYFDRHQFF
jgi:hypothetical protein